MSNTTETPQAPAGFQTRMPEEPTGPKVSREHLRQGVIVQYRGTRQFPRSTEGGGFSTVHTFISRGGEGKRFSVYGTAQLDSILRSMRAGAIVWLRYAGMEDVEKKQTHTWFVSEANKGVSAEQVRRMRQNYKAEEKALDDAIDAVPSTRGQADGAPHPADADDDAPEWAR